MNLRALVGRTRDRHGATVTANATDDRVGDTAAIRKHYVDVETVPPVAHIRVDGSGLDLDVYGDGRSSRMFGGVHGGLAARVDERLHLVVEITVTNDDRF